MEAFAATRAKQACQALSAEVDALVRHEIQNLLQAYVERKMVEGRK